MRVIGKPSLVSAEVDLAFKSIPRFCYRSHFSKISTSSLESDKGWCCCFRSTQGILSQFFIRFKEKNPKQYQGLFGDVNPLTLFYDKADAPFSIQNLVTNASKYGIPIGKWGKPSKIAFGIQDIFKSLNLSCIVGQHFTILQSDIDSATFPSLVLIPGLFGLRKMDPQYIPFLQLCLCIPDSLGFISGKKNSAFFFCGFDQKQFVYFDPHVLKTAAVSENDIPSFFSLPQKTILCESINPSILLAFMCENKDSLFCLLQILLGCSPTPVGITNDGEIEKALESTLDIDDIV